MKITKRRAPILATALLAACSGSSSDSIILIGFPATGSPIDSTYSFQANVERASGAVTYALTGPTGMTVTAGGLVQWTTTYDDLGTYNVNLTATDAEGTSDTLTWILRIHQGMELGVSLSPRGHTGSSTPADFAEFYLNEEHGSAVSFHLAWRDTLQDAGTIPGAAQSAMAAAEQYGFIPVIGFGWTDGDGNPDLLSESDQIRNSWVNPETRAEFRTMVTNFAGLYQPQLLFLGNETNTYFVTHTQTEWDDWISMFEECYDAIKAASPMTIVFTTFQLERMKGLGANAGWADPAHWQLIDDHTQSGKIDAVAFTSYPYLEYDAPADIPADYYTEITTYYTGPVGFSEIGWLSAPSGPVPGSEDQQSEFLAAFWDGTSTLDFEYVAWLFLHDFDQDDTTPAFDAIGLRDNTGADIRPVDAFWRDAVVLRQR